MKECRSCSRCLIHHTMTLCCYSLLLLVSMRWWLFYVVFLLLFICQLIHILSQAWNAQEDWLYRLPLHILSIRLPLDILAHVTRQPLSFRLFDTQKYDSPPPTPHLSSAYENGQLLWIEYSIYNFWLHIETNFGWVATKMSLSLVNIDNWWKEHRTATWLIFTPDMNISLLITYFLCKLWCFRKTAD